jgi:hypothetical protein
MEKKAALNLEEEIAELKAEIVRCWSRHDGTEDDELKKTYAAIIKTHAASFDKLLLLLQQRDERKLLAQQHQKQPSNSGSNFIIFSTYLIEVNDRSSGGFTMD